MRGHLRTLFAIHDVDDMIRLDTPWWTYGSIRVVEEHLGRLDGGARVFEYGSGASSLWLAARSGEVHTVEHDAGFAEVMRDALTRSGLADKVTLHEVPAEDSGTPVTRSGRRGEDSVDYTAYARSIELPGGDFDLVVVDGRARVACLHAALGQLAPGGLVVFDDAQRPRYRAGIRSAGLPVRAIWGMVPSLPYPRQTAVLGPAAAS
ncbi:MAG TPA: class I SAM-dependent methyltransferase [Pengzhenrongella sp.]